MKLLNVRKEVYKPTVIKGIETTRAITDDDGTVVIQLHGTVFKDVTVYKDKEAIIGKYAIGLASNGKKALLIKEIFTRGNVYRMKYEVIDGANEPLFLVCDTVEKMPFYVYDRVEDILRYEKFSKERNTLTDNNKDKIATASKEDKRIICAFRLLDGFSSFGKVYTDFTMDDKITFNYAVTDVDGVNAVIRIIEKNKHRNEITFEVMRSPLAYNKRVKTSGFGTFTANVGKGSFKLYEFFRDAVHDYNFLQKTH